MKEVAEKVSTTTNCVRIMNNLIKDENLGKVVPIVQIKQEHLVWKACLSK